MVTLSCGGCYTAPSGDNHLVAYSCGHVYCRDCAHRWTKWKCPTCRKSCRSEPMRLHFSHEQDADSDDLRDVVYQDSDGEWRLNWARIKGNDDTLRLVTAAANLSDSDRLELALAANKYDGVWTKMLNGRSVHSDAASALAMATLRRLAIAKPEWTGKFFGADIKDVFMLSVHSARNGDTQERSVIALAWQHMLLKLQANVLKTALDTLWPSLHIGNPAGRDLLCMLMDAMKALVEPQYSATSPTYSPRSPAYSPDDHE